MRSIPILIIAIALVTMLTIPLAAQTNTGRHRTQPVAEPDTTSVSSRPQTNWYIMPGVGLFSGGDLLRFRTPGDPGVPWDPPGGVPFVSDDVVLTLDESFALALAVGRRLSDSFWLRLDFSMSQVPITALARIGESAATLNWDELSVVMAGLAAEWRVMPTLSYIYLLGGGGITTIAGNGSDAYDQTKAHLRIGGGYHLNLGSGWGLRGELRDSIQDLDFSDYRPPVIEGGIYPNVSVEDHGTDHFVELLLMVNGSF